MDLSIEGAADGQGASVEHVGVDHSGFDVFVPKQFLHGADVVAIFEQGGGEGMPECMGGDTLGNPGLAGGLSNRFLNTGFADVVTALLAATRVDGCFSSGENILPHPLTGSIGVFAVEGIGHID